MLTSKICHVKIVRFLSNFRLISSSRHEMYPAKLLLVQTCSIYRTRGHVTEWNITFWWGFKLSPTNIQFYEHAKILSVWNLLEVYSCYFKWNYIYLEPTGEIFTCMRQRITHIDRVENAWIQFSQKLNHEFNVFWGLQLCWWLWRWQF